MPLYFRDFAGRAAMALLAGWCVGAQAFDPVADMALLYTAQVDRTLIVPVVWLRPSWRKPKLPLSDPST